MSNFHSSSLAGRIAILFTFTAVSADDYVIELCELLLQSVLENSGYADCFTWNKPTVFVASVCS